MMLMHDIFIYIFEDKLYEKLPVSKTFQTNLNTQTQMDKSHSTTSNAYT